MILSLHYSIPLTGGQYIRDVYVEGTGISNFSAKYYVVCDVMSKSKLRKFTGSVYFQRRDLERGGLFFLGLCLDLERERNSWLNALFYPSLNHFMCFLCPFVKIKDFFCLTQPTEGDHLDPALKNRVLCASSCDSCKLAPNTGNTSNKPEADEASTLYCVRSVLL